MLNIKKILVAAALTICGAANATTVYVGSWHLGDGPQWSAATQTAYTGQEAAALLFGGTASDYVISTISALVADINGLTWMDQYGVGIGAPLADDYSNGTTYTYGVVSAYVLDNSCGNRYSDPASACTDQYVNYAFRITSTNVPEPSSIALLALGAAAVFAARRKKSA